MTRRTFERPDPQEQTFWLLFSLLGLALAAAAWIEFVN
jgi:hypothetical protein